MKLVAFVLAAVAMMSFTAWGAEKDNFDLFAVAGAGIGMGGLNVGPTTTMAGIELTKKQDNFLNFGSGLKLEGGAEFKLMPHLYGQGALSYTNGLWGINQVNDITGVDKVTDQYFYSMFGVKALVKPTFQVLDLFTVYTGFGVGLFFSWLTINRTETSAAGDFSARADDSQWPSVGLIGSLGVEYPLTHAIVLFGELQCEAMNFTTSQRTISKSTYPEGSDWSNQIINYETNAVDRDTPANTPGTNLGIRVGVRFPLL